MIKKVTRIYNRLIEKLLNFKRKINKNIMIKRRQLWLNIFVFNKAVVRFVRLIIIADCIFMSSRFRNTIEKSPTWIDVESTRRLLEFLTKRNHRSTSLGSCCIVFANRRFLHQPHGAFSASSHAFSPFD